MPAKELTGRWPIHPESENPHNAIYIRNNKRLFVGPTKMTHEQLFNALKLETTNGSNIVDDAGEAIVEDDLLTISNYRAESVSIRTFHREYSSASQMQSAFDDERKYTAGLICQLTGKRVHVQMWNNQFFIVEF